MTAVETFFSRSDSRGVPGDFCRWTCERAANLVAGPLARQVQGSRSTGYRDAEYQGSRVDHGGPEAAVADGVLVDVFACVETLRPCLAGGQLQTDQGPWGALRGRLPRLLRPGGTRQGDPRGRDRR